MPRDPGRVAGLWYLLLVALGPLRLIVIPTRLFVRGDATATAANLLAHETLFRLGVADDLLAAVVLVVLTLALYRLFQGVDRPLAALVVVLGGVMPATLYFVNVVSDLGALSILQRPAYLSVFDPAQQDALVLLLLRLHDQLNTAAETLWGAWLFPLGALTCRSRFLPRFLGVWLVIGGVAYLAMSFTGVLAPALQGRVFTLSQPARLGEVAFMLWLVFRGAKPRPAPAFESGAATG